MGDVKSHHDPKRLILNNYFGVCGGDEGIRTLERLPVTPLAGERLRPLGHVSTDAYNRANIRFTRPKTDNLAHIQNDRFTGELAWNGTHRHTMWARFGHFPYLQKRGQSNEDLKALVSIQMLNYQADLSSVDHWSVRTPVQKETNA